MPNISKQFYLEVTVEQFLTACSYTELQEINMRLDAHIRRHELAHRKLERISEGVEQSKTTLKDSRYESDFD